MFGCGECYDCTSLGYYTGEKPYHSSCKGAWFVLALLIWVALFFFGGIGWLLLLLGIILFFGKKLFNFIF